MQVISLTYTILAIKLIECTVTRNNATSRQGSIMIEEDIVGVRNKDMFSHELVEWFSNQKRRFKSVYGIMKSLLN
jgi:hypothetical protein